MHTKNINKIGGYTNSKKVKKRKTLHEKDFKKTNEEEKTYLCRK